MLVSDWPLLNVLLNAASGATGVTLHHIGRVGIGYSQHAGMVIVAGGRRQAAGGRRQVAGGRRQAARLERVLWNARSSRVMRHPDANCVRTRKG